MKKAFLIIILFTATVFGQSAIEYHDKMMVEVSKVSNALNQFNASLETDSAYFMHTSRSFLKKTLDSSLVNIKAINEFNGDDDWHKAVLIQMQYYRTCIDKEFVKFIDYSLRMTILNEDEMADFMRTMNRVKLQADQNSELVKIAYEEFCKNNKIQIK